MGYKWCVVPLCRNSSIRTPSKIFISVPKNGNIRRKWLQVSRRKPEDILTNTNVFMCEDHFDLPNDMENYMKYKIMGGLKQIRMKKDCIPTRFDCQPKRNVETSTLVREIVDANETEATSTSGIIEDSLDTSAIIEEVPEIELDQPEYWYPEESDSTPESCSHTGFVRSNPGLNPNFSKPNASFSEEYQRFLSNKISNPTSKKKKHNIETTDTKKVTEDTGYSYPENNDKESEILAPIIVKQEIEEIIVKEELEDVEFQCETQQEEEKFKDYLDSVKTEAIEIGEVFFTLTDAGIGNRQEKEEEAINGDCATGQSVSSVHTDGESTETASEAEYYYNKKNTRSCGRRRKTRTKRISAKTVDIEQSKSKLRTPTYQRLNSKLHKCPSCNFSTSNELSLNFHIIDVHQKLTTKSFECKYCNYNTDIEKFLEKHVTRLHSRAEKYKCEHCPYSTSTKASMSVHVHTVHPDIKQLECEHCDFRTNRECTLKNHIRCVHLKLKRHKCEQCDYESHHKPSLEHHINRNHLNIGRFACEHCNYRTDYKTCLKRHTSTAHVDLKKYKCEECNYRGNSQAIVEMHRNKAHLKVKKLKCQRCNFETFCKEVLENHIESVHNEVRLLKCEFCYFQSQHSAAIKRHVDTIHFKSENLACGYCDYASGDKSSLKRHVTTNHSSEQNVVVIEDT